MGAGKWWELGLLGSGAGLRGAGVKLRGGGL